MRPHFALLCLLALGACGKSSLHQDCSSVFASCDSGQVCMAHVNIAGETTGRTCEIRCGGESDPPCPDGFECGAIPDELGPHCAEKR